jgi:hypothetical protein
MAVAAPQPSTGPSTGPPIPLWVGWLIGTVGLGIIVTALLTWAPSPLIETTVREVTTTTTSSARLNGGANTGPDIVTVDKLTTTDAQRPRPSDTVTNALLTLGGITLLAAAFFPRISGITLLGSGLTLSSQTANQVLQQVITEAQKVAGVKDNPSKVADAYQRAILAVRSDALVGALRPARGIAQRMSLAPLRLHPDYTAEIAKRAVDEVAKEP